MTALSGEDLLAWFDDTSRRWTELLAQHPEVMMLPCDVRESQTVAQLLQHIVAVELRYAERLSELPTTSYEDLSYSSVAAIAGVHRRAMELLQPLLERDDAFWAEPIQFATRSAGEMTATRRVILVHLAMHSIRHYAQLATLVRQHGISPGWMMDYLFQSARPV